MKLRVVLAMGLACGLGFAGCEKKEDESQKAAQAAAEQAKAVAEAAAAKQVEAAKAEAEAAKAAVEAEAAKKVEEAKAAADVAAAEAAKKVEEAKAAAEAEAAKKVEEAKVAAEAEAAKKLEADAAALAEAEKAKLLEQKDTVIQLAVDLGCLKKKETDAQKLLKDEQDLLAAAELDQRAYLNALDALKAADPSVATQIDSAVEACPSAEDVIRGKVIGVEVLNRCLLEAKVKPERMSTLQAGILEQYELTAEEFATLRDKYKNEPWFQPSLDEGVKSCPPIPEEALETAEEAEAKLEKDDQGKAKPRPSRQTLKGTIFGSANGTLTVHLMDTRIRAGTAVIGSTQIPLQGYVMKGGKITFKGQAGANSIRGFGKFDRAGRITGSWNATLGGKRKSGSFMLHR